MNKKGFYFTQASNVTSRVGYPKLVVHGCFAVVDAKMHFIYLCISDAEITSVNFLSPLRFGFREKHRKHKFNRIIKIYI